jgi:hypothetical protein
MPNTQTPFYGGENDSVLSELSCDQYKGATIDASDGLQAII